MEIVQVYAIVLAGMACFTIIFAHHIELLKIGKHLFKALVMRLVSHRIGRYLVKVPLAQLSTFRSPPQYGILPAINLQSFLAVVLYLAANVVCLCLKQTSTLDYGSRAGYLTVINLTVPLAGLSLSFLANITGLTLRQYVMIHRLTGVASFAGGVAHGVIMMQSKSITFQSVKGGREMLLCLISLACLTLLFNRFLRRWLYEMTFLIHRCLSVLLLYGIWQHTKQISAARVYLYIAVAICCCTTVIHSCTTIFKNALFRDRLPRVEITQSQKVVLLTIKLSRPIQAHPGQYINLCIPGISKSSILQSHPLTVAAVLPASNNEDMALELIVVPQTGFTAELLRVAGQATEPYRAIISGPYGPVLHPNRYRSVLGIASGPGIIAQLPFLRHVVDSRVDDRSGVRKMWLIWIIEDAEKIELFERAINQMLEHDPQGETLVIKIHGPRATADVDFGQKNRAKLIAEKPDFTKIIKEAASFAKEWAPKPHTIDDNMQSKGLLVTVSATHSIRREIVRAARPYIGVDNNIVELEYQPPE